MEASIGHVSLIHSANITGKYTLAVHFVVFKLTRIDAPVRKAQRALAVVVCLLELAFVNKIIRCHQLALTFTPPTYEVTEIDRTVGKSQRALAVVLIVFPLTRIDRAIWILRSTRAFDQIRHEVCLIDSSIHIANRTRPIKLAIDKVSFVYITCRTRATAGTVIHSLTKATFVDAATVMSKPALSPELSMTPLACVHGAVVLDKCAETMSFSV
mmetsp:Transcript_23078/g.39931  ORF Transcript_23078/g.39931 Transcript_23078/m.39931 type:complete len:213 (-) Transcript_23078:139-777(-)